MEDTPGMLEFILSSGWVLTVPQEVGSGSTHPGDQASPLATAWRQHRDPRGHFSSEGRRLFQTAREDKV